MTMSTSPMLSRVMLMRTFRWCAKPPLPVNLGVCARFCFLDRRESNVLQAARRRVEAKAAASAVPARRLKDSEKKSMTKEEMDKWVANFQAKERAEREQQATSGRENAVEEVCVGGLCVLQYAC